MKWLLTFLLGALVGAVALFAWLRQVPDDPPVLESVAPPLQQQPNTYPAAALPDAPEVEPDLTAADLPLRPPVQARAAVEALPPLDDSAATGPGKLLVPVQGIKASELVDTFNQPRGSERKHEALDIMAPKGTPVVAAGDGKVVKLFESRQGGLTLYQFDPTERYAYYYAHLDRYADGIKEGTVLKRGDLLGYVGATGNADPKAPHLHFAVIELTPEKRWWKGTPIDPYPLLVH